MPLSYLIETRPKVELSFFWDGAALVESLEEIYDLCERRRMRTPDQFVSEERFFPASEGIEYFQRLAKAIDRNPRAFDDEGAAALAAVEDLVELLKEVQEKGAEFRLDIS